MSFADRDFYYGDPYFSPEEPMKGLLSKEYAKQRAAQIKWDKNDPYIGPGDPYPFEGKTNPYTELIKKLNAPVTDGNRNFVPSHDSTVAFNFQPNNIIPINGDIVSSGLSDGGLPLEGKVGMGPDADYMDRLWRGTTSVEAADKDGWVVSITPSGGWLPACIAGNTGIGMSQRFQSFVLDKNINPFNVVEPGKRPRVTLTPSLALKDGKPYLSFAVQGGDTQDQNLLQFFLNVVEFGMTVQQACEAANINSNQLWLSLGGTKTSDRKPHPGEILVGNTIKDEVKEELKKMGYKVQTGNRTSGPINAIYFDWKHGSFWGGSSNNGEDYGIGW
jgi:gamma-glutamyltranspeptidase/glutathione hydrolase